MEGREGKRRTDLRSVSSVGAASLGEHGLELAEALLGDAVADPVVLLDRDGDLVARLGVRDLRHDGHDLRNELAGLLRGGGLLERLGCKVVLHVARDVVLFGDVLGRDAHGEEAVGRFLDFEDGFRHLGGGGGCGASAKWG